MGPEELDPPPTLRARSGTVAAVGNSSVVLRRVKRKTTIQPDNSTPGQTPKRRENGCSNRDLYNKNVRGDTVHGGRPKADGAPPASSPAPADQWLKKLYYIPPTDTKRNEMPTLLQHGGPSKTLRRAKEASCKRRMVEDPIYLKCQEQAHPQ